MPLCMFPRRVVLEVSTAPTNHAYIAHNHGANENPQDERHQPTNQQTNQPTNQSNSDRLPPATCNKRINKMSAVLTGLAPGTETFLTVLFPPPDPSLAAPSTPVGFSVGTTAAASATPTAPAGWTSAQALVEWDRPPSCRGCGTGHRQLSTPPHHAPPLPSDNRLVMPSTAV